MKKPIQIKAFTFSLNDQKDDIIMKNMVFFNKMRNFK